MEKQHLEIETLLGKIVVEECHDPSFPGFYLSLRRNDQTYGICLLEVVQYDPSHPELKAHIWSPSTIWEDPSVSMSFEKTEVDKMFEED